MDELVQMGIYGNRDFSLKKVSPIYIKYEKVCQKYQKFIKKYLRRRRIGQNWKKITWTNCPRFLALLPPPKCCVFLLHF
jgi:hypothetical protein